MILAALAPLFLLGRRRWIRKTRSRRSAGRSRRPVRWQCVGRRLLCAGARRASPSSSCCCGCRCCCG